MYCDQVIARKLQVFTFHDDAHNCDGINVDSSTNVLIEHSLFDTKDDCVCMKAGINEDGLRVNRPTENVVVRHVVTKRGHGGAVFGSDTSGWIRNVYVHDCIYDGTLMGIRFKSTRGRGGGVENILLENIQMKDIPWQAITLDKAYRAWFGTEDGVPPVFRNIHIRNVSGIGAREAVKLAGLPDTPMENVTLEDVTLSAGRGLHANNVTGLNLTNVSIRTESGPAMTFEQVEDVVID